MKKKDIIVYTFQSLEDPLIKGLMLQYLLDLSSKDNYQFHLITHEQEVFKLSTNEEVKRKKELEEQNIIWYPLQYHNGKWLLIKKLFDFLKSAWLCFWIKWKFSPKVIIGFLPIAAGFSSILAPVLRMKLITYCFEPHSEYMVDFGIWSKNSLKYALLRKFERSQLEIATDIIVPTQYTAKLADKINPYARKFVFPISIDTDKNILDVSARNEFREKFNLQNKKVILYMGKFGGIYYDIPTLVDFLCLFQSKKDYHILIISSDKKEIDQYLFEKKLDPTFFTILDFIPYEKIHSYISIADLGLVAVPPLPSQKYRTPVKTGLYLSCGIPYLINKGIAEDDIIAEKENVGVVVNDFLTVNRDDLEIKITQLLADPNLRTRCRQTAIQYRSHQQAVQVMEKMLKHHYL